MRYRLVAKNTGFRAIHFSSSQITSVITEPERKSMLQLARASPASRASHCYVAFDGEDSVSSFVNPPNESATNSMNAS